MVEKRPALGRGLSALIPGGTPAAASSSAKPLEVDTDLLTPTTLAKGDEMARFNMGSTVILLLPRGAGTWNDALVAGRTLRMGERIGTLQGCPA